MSIASVSDEPPLERVFVSLPQPATVPFERSASEWALPAAISITVPRFAGTFVWLSWLAPHATTEPSVRRPSACSPPAATLPSMPAENGTRSWPLAFEPHAPTREKVTVSVAEPAAAS